MFLCMVVTCCLIHVHVHTDTSYSDPIGPAAERPKTAARRRDEQDDFGDEELGEDLLPE